jgi:hypothetical protein
LADEASREGLFLVPTLAIDPEHKNAQLNRAQALELKQNLQRLR